MIHTFGKKYEVLANGKNTRHVFKIHLKSLQRSISFRYKLKTEKEYEEATYPNGRPYVRYLARFLDLSLFSLFLIALVSIFFPQFLTKTSGLTIFIISLILWVVVEPIIITIFGNTLGRAFYIEKSKVSHGEDFQIS